MTIFSQCPGGGKHEWEKATVGRDGNGKHRHVHHCRKCGKTK